MPLLPHPNIKHVTSEVELQSDGTVKTVLVVHTDLVLDASQSGYDKAKMDRLVADLAAHMKAYPDTVDRIRVQRN